MKMKNKINNTLKYFKENIVFFITLIVIIIAFNVNLPYSIYSPGGINLSTPRKLKFNLCHIP